MSSRLKKLKGSRPPLPQCGACGRGIPKAMWRKRLRDGRLVCQRCADAGVLCQRLPCGHFGMPGMTVAADSAGLDNFQCPQCSPHLNPVIG